MRVTVTQEHINKGIRGSNTYCPIALALKGRGCEGVSVLHTTCYLNGHNYKMPLAARQFISRFDYLQPVKPLKFEMRKY